MMWDLLAAGMEIAAFIAIFFVCLFVIIGAPIMIFLWGKVFYEFIKGTK